MTQQLPGITKGTEGLLNFRVKVRSFQPLIVKASRLRTLLVYVMTSLSFCLKASSSSKLAVFMVCCTKTAFTTFNLGWRTDSLVQHGHHRTTHLSCQFRKSTHDLSCFNIFMALRTGCSCSTCVAAEQHCKSNDASVDQEKTKRTIPESCSSCCRSVL